MTVPDALMEPVVKTIVGRYFKARKRPKTIYFAADHIKKEWLPLTRNVKFVVLERDQLSAKRRKVYFFDYQYSLQKK